MSKWKKDKLIHNDLHCFYSEQFQGKGLYCLHNCTALNSRFVMCELHDRNRKNYVKYDAKQLNELLSNCYTVKEGDIGLHAHGLANKDTPRYLRDRISLWRWEGSCSGIYAPAKGAIGQWEVNESDASIVSNAFRMINMINLLDEDETDPEFANYLRRLYQAEQNMYNGQPVLVDVIDNEELPTGSEDFFLRSLKITCVPYSNGELVCNPTWKFTAVTVKDWVSQNKKDASSKVSIILENSDFFAFLRKNCHALGIYDSFKQLFPEFTDEK